MLDINIESKIFKIADGTELEAIKNIVFSASSGSFTCIVGPSGCGKTTTLRLILGLDNTFAGHIHIKAQSNSSGRVAAVFQEPRLLPWRSVEQNIRLALPDSQKGQSLDELFIELGIDHVKHFFPGELSLGLARRVALARAYALEPELLVLDEPFVSLDEKTANRLRHLLITLCESRPTTTLMVTHNVSEAAALADRIIVLSDRPATILENFLVDVPRAERDDEMLLQTVRYINSISSV